MKHSVALARSFVLSCVLAFTGCIEASQESVAYDAVVVSSSANLVARSPSPVMGSALHGGSGAAAPLLGGGPHLPFP